MKLDVSLKYPRSFPTDHEAFSHRCHQNTIKFKKINHSLLAPRSEYLADLILPLIPQWVTANDITIFKFITCAIASVLFYLASFHKAWLLLVTLPLFLSWVADSLDGKVARTRNQTSDKGFFLDLFSDALGSTLIGLGIAFSSYTVFALWAIVPMLQLLLTIVILFGITLKQEFRLPAIGFDEDTVMLIVLAIAGFYVYEPMIAIGNYALGLFDLLGIFALFSTSSAIIKFAVSLYKEL